MNQPRDWMAYELRQLQPRGLSPETIRRLQELAPPAVPHPEPTIPASRWRLTWSRLRLPALAALFLLASGSALLVLYRRPPRPPQPVTADSSGAACIQAPIAYQVTPTRIFDEGIWTFGNGKPVRRVRREYLRELRVVDAATGQTVIVHEPASEIVLVQLEHY